MRLPVVLVPESLREELREVAAQQRVAEAELVREALRREIARQRRRAERELLAESAPPEGPDVAR